MSGNLQQKSLSDLARDFLACPNMGLSEKNILAYILASVASQPSGLVTEDYDEIGDVEYYGSTNNIKTIPYKKNGIVVATVTITYVNDGDDDNDLFLNASKS